MPLKDKITSIVTGDAYDKPAKTVDGALTTQGSDNAHTIEGTSADPNSTGSGTSDLANKAKGKMDEVSDKTGDLGQQAKEKGQEAKQKADQERE